MYEFDWNQRKAKLNLKKHGVSFEEAEAVFYDSAGLLLGDPEHSDDETRFVLLGLGARLRCLVVCHAYDEDEDVIRIISARRAKKSERRFYEERKR